MMIAILDDGVHHNAYCFWGSVPITLTLFGLRCILHHFANPGRRVLLVQTLPSWYTAIHQL